MRSYREVIVHDSGKRIDNALVEVRELGTTTPVTDLYIAETGGDAVVPARVLTKDGGKADFWLSSPRDVTLYVTDNEDTATYTGSSQTLSFAPKSITSYADRAAGVLFVPTGTLAAGNVQDALAEENSERQAADNARILTSAKGQANGVAPLGADSKVPTANLPAPPAVPVQSVNGETGTVVLDAEDVGAASPGTLADAQHVTAVDLNQMYDVIDRIASGFVLDSTFVDQGVPAAIAAQPTVYGRMPHGLVGFDNRVFIEYGDYDANTGPIKLLCWDHAASAFVEEDELATEQVRYKVVGSDLWALAIDPRGTAPPSYARRSVGGSWTEVALPVEPSHVFDVVEMGGVIYLATQTDDPNSVNFDATIWASTDNGVTWTDIKRFPPLPSGGTARAWMMLTVGGALYVEPFHSNFVPIPGSRGVAERFDGTTWTEAPSMLSPSDDVGWDGYLGPVGYKALNITGGPSVGWALYLGHHRERTRVTTLNAYNGTERRTIRRGVRDFTLTSGQSVHALDALGRVDLLAPSSLPIEDRIWRPRRFGPTVSVENGYSMAVVGGAMYIATIDGHLWKGAAV